MNLIKNWRLWLGLIISALCLWLALRNVPMQDLAGLMTGMNVLWIVLAIALQFVAVVTRARRWTVLLGKPDRLAESFWAQGIGYLFTNVLPLRMGEPARVIVMAERCQLPVVQVAASALVERLLDVATIVLLLVLLLPWMQIPSVVANAGVTFGILILAAMAVLILSVILAERVEGWLRQICQRFSVSPRLTAALIERWQELVQGLLPLTRWQSSLQIIAWSLVTWACSIGVYVCALRSFQADASLVEAAFMVVALSLAVTVPSSPGFIGVFQLVGQQALVLPFGEKYNAATALAITLTAHLIYYLLTTALGVIGLWRLGESFAGLWRAIRVKAEPDPNVTRSVE